MFNRIISRGADPGNFRSILLLGARALSAITLGRIPSVERIKRRLQEEVNQQAMLKQRA
ncbi:hypothetical protein [Paenibacillus sp. J22TS3]|uniref:hypothetical protein n=1 Tax=Paenibacillus sp. J22TS3 TaxID=2807192 RepID=UPI001B17E564|nr:hypothetical protein [Paenibacillus sp. J22TS3]GIP24316.1 hypothetical protein J22TS3_45910 [Paenibacillus sp. J22TS3]